VQQLGRIIQPDQKEAGLNRAQRAHETGLQAGEPEGQAAKPRSNPPSIAPARRHPVRSPGNAPEPNPPPSPGSGRGSVAEGLATRRTEAIDPRPIRPRSRNTGRLPSSHSDQSRKKPLARIASEET